MLSIVILQYNKAGMTQNCIDSILKNTTKQDYEIVLIDNGSTEEISNEYKEKVNFVKVRKNIFFAAGCNLGAAKANGDKLCFLNNDIIVTSGWNNLLATLTDKIGIVGTKLLYSDNTIQHAGIDARPAEGLEACFDHRYRHKHSDYPPANILRSYQAVTGACIFVDKKDFFAIDGFDDEYINGHEDFDLCMKVRFKLNKPVVYDPRAIIYHFESQTARDKTNTNGINNHLKFYHKWGSLIINDRHKWDLEDEKLNA